MDVPFFSLGEGARTSVLFVHGYGGVLFNLNEARCFSAESHAHT